MKNFLNSDLEKKMFIRYWLGHGDYYLQPEEFAMIIKSGKVVSKLWVGYAIDGNIVNKQIFNYYSDKNLNHAIGHGVVHFNENGSPIGFYDVYDFPKSPWGTRTVKDEILTRLVKTFKRKKALPFQIIYQSQN